VSALKFYLDGDVWPEVAVQLRRVGIDAVPLQELGRQGASDISHLAAALAMNQVLCTHDQDYLRLAGAGATHAGIANIAQARASTSRWVTGL